MPSNKIDTIGRVLLRDSLPDNLRDWDTVLDKGGAKKLFRELALKSPEKYVDTMDKLNELSSAVSTERGRDASLSLKDLELPPSIKLYRKKIQADVDKIAQDPNLTMQQKNDKIVSYLRKRIDDTHTKVRKAAMGEKNAFAAAIEHGFRGSPSQFTQLIFGDMLVADYKGDPIPIAGLHGYGEGVTPAEYWAGSYGSRKGFADVQFSTAQTGYFGKRLALSTNKIQVTGKDCGAENIGLRREGGDADNIGSVLATPVGKYKAGTVITQKMLPDLDDKNILVRSIATCQQPEGVCQKCSGKRETGDFPSVGDYIGVHAARVTSEPLTQLGLSSKHTGGALGSESQELSGFEEIEQFVDVPKQFVGKAILSPADGRVSKIFKAPQGGHYAIINGEQTYIPGNRKLSVKTGDTVEAGDVLTDGTPNPAEIASYKGLGEGRKYFIDKFHELLEKHDIPTHKRNIEVLARGFFNKVRVTDPEGIAGYEIDEKVPYSDLQRKYKPRVGSERKPVSRTVSGKYLEEPVLHYTIGTRVTPKVVDTLKESGIKDIMVNSKEPGFKPEVTRLMDIPGTDPDWKIRMAGFGLKKGFMDAAAHGSISKTKNPSYIPKLMDVSKL